MINNTKIAELDALINQKKNEIVKVNYDIKQCENDLVGLESNNSQLKLKLSQFGFDSNQNINSGQNIVSFSNAKKKSKKIYYFIPAVSAAALLCLVLLISSTNNKITLDEEKSAVAQIDQFTKENHNVCVVDKGELLEDDALFGTFSDETVDEDNSTTELSHRFMHLKMEATLVL